MRFVIFTKTVSLTNAREHWSARARRAKSHRRSAYFASTELRGARLPVTITITRVSPRKLDDDNLRGALKSIRDGIADQLGVDDGDDRITWLYRQKKGTPPAVIIEA